MREGESYRAVQLCGTGDFPVEMRIRRRGSARPFGVMPTALYPMDPVIPRERSGADKAGRGLSLSVRSVLLSSARSEGDHIRPCIAARGVPVLGFSVRWVFLSGNLGTGRKMFVRTGNMYRVGRAS